ncbi:hypothetical protein HYX07_00170 [Candidatus Woesearchaeota archaeon]|nr:hypothetical protein [Candidatus Woesearchaeota archaeon]
MELVGFLDVYVRYSKNHFPTTPEEYKDISCTKEYNLLLNKIKLKHDQKHLILLEIYGCRSNRQIDFISEDKDVVGESAKAGIMEVCPHVNPISLTDAIKNKIF